MVVARGAVTEEHVGNVQKGGPLEADVDEGGLHAGQHARDLAGVDVADATALEFALEVQFLHRAVLDDGDARFLRCPVDEDVLHRGRCLSALVYVETGTPAQRSSVAVS